MENSTTKLHDMNNILEYNGWHAYNIDACITTGYVLSHPHITMLYFYIIRGGESMNGYAWIVVKTSWITSWIPCTICALWAAIVRCTHYRIIGAGGVNVMLVGASECPLMAIKASDNHLASNLSWFDDAAIKIVRGLSQFGIYASLVALSIDNAFLWNV